MKKQTLFSQTLIKLVKITATIMSVFAISTANAANKSTIFKEPCNDESLTNLEYSQCLDGVKTKIDHELTLWVNNQIFALEELSKVTGRTSALSMFKRSQRNFETYRENNCRWQFLALSPGTSAAPAYKKCYILISQNRIDELTKLAPNQ